MNILEKIVQQKRHEVADRKVERTLTELKERPLYAAPRRSLAYTLALPGSTGIIAEFKRKSPSKGWIAHELASPRIAVPAYDQYGAAGISILTDAPFFGGNLSDLEESRTMVEAPLLRKDFTIDPYQLHEARAFGADVILLIAAILEPAQVRELAAEAKSLGLEVLLELHGDEELGHVCPEVDLVGINNRNLKTFSVDLDRSVQLAKALPAGKLKVAESGISSPEDLLFLKAHGFDGFLIGERFMKEADPGSAFAAFVGNIKKLSDEA
ncbi:indole-3-glycerol phosphate synthase TrpC [Flaviaesturariibacter amylovorans]|uniref:Indole-3-glycerol phosphate synthase n=1 Tax=Flaviaesturariibacter amylovorans TaxID=1084520 RepID=A0ABP8GET1_9BACT